MQLNRSLSTSSPLLPAHTGELAASVFAAYSSKRLHSFINNLKTHKVVFSFFSLLLRFWVGFFCKFHCFLLCCSSKPRGLSVRQCCEVGLLLRFLNAEMKRSGWAHHPPWNPPFLFFIGYRESPPPSPKPHPFHNSFPSIFPCTQSPAPVFYFSSSRVSHSFFLWPAVRLHTFFIFAQVSGSDTWIVWTLEQ